MVKCCSVELHDLDGNIAKNTNAVAICGKPSARW